MSCLRDEMSLHASIDLLLRKDVASRQTMTVNKGHRPIILLSELTCTSWTSETLSPKSPSAAADTATSPFSRFTSRACVCFLFACTLLGRPSSDRATSDQPTDPTKQLTNRPTNQLTDQANNVPTNPSTNQPTTQLSDQRINRQSINQPINQ